MPRHPVCVRMQHVWRSCRLLSLPHRLDAACAHAKVRPTAARATARATAEHFASTRCPQCRTVLDARSLGFELDDDRSSDTELSDTDVDGDTDAHHLVHSAPYRVTQQSRLRFGRPRPLSAGQISPAYAAPAALGRDSALHAIMRRLRWPPVGGGDSVRVARGNPTSFLRRSFG